MKRLLALVAAAAGVAPVAMAESGPYVGGGAAAFVLDQGGDSVGVGGLQGRVGYSLSSWLQVEGEATFGTFDGEYEVGPTTVDVSLDHEYGAFLVGTLPIPLLPVDLYGRVGYASMSFQNSAAGGALVNDVDGSGLAVGAGAELELLNLRLRFEYTRYEIDEAEIDGGALMLVAQF